MDDNIDGAPRTNVRSDLTEDGPDDGGMLESAQIAGGEGGSRCVDDDQSNGDLVGENGARVRGSIPQLQLRARGPRWGSACAKRHAASGDGSVRHGIHPRAGSCGRANAQLEGVSAGAWLVAAAGDAGEGRRGGSDASESEAQVQHGEDGAEAGGQIRGRVHCGREEVNRAGRRMVSGEVARVPTGLGSLEDQREAGDRPHRDLGAALRGAEHGGIDRLERSAELASGSAAVELERRGRGRPPSTTPTTRPQCRSAEDEAADPKKRCQEKLYLRLKEELAARNREVKSLKTLLDRERQQRARLMEGERRRMQVELDESVQRCKLLEEKNAGLEKRRKYDRCKLDEAIEEATGELRSEVASLLAQLDTLKSENSALIVELTSLKRSRAAVRREADRKRSRCTATVDGMQAVLCDTMARAADFEARAAASEARALDSEARAADSEARRVEAVAGAEQAATAAAAQLSTREQELQRNMEDVLQQYKDAALQAETAKALAEHKANLMHAKTEELKQQLAAYPALPASRSVDEWALLGREAKWKASQRERLAFRSLLECHEWRAEGIAQVLGDLNLLRDVMLKTRAGFRIHFQAVQELMSHLENEEFGRDLGLFIALRDASHVRQDLEAHAGGVQII